ncbi:MAG: cadmium resistance transporter [Pseudomonadales bacterium]|nr:cadmium resistance transporter [Pseudomonadales bacterium]MDG1443032.1 cadmium resistance transporter [Pseudomonadales bacterium]
MNLLDLITLTTLVVSTFAVTNLDNLIILVFLLGQSPNARQHVLMGFVAAVILVIAVSSVGILIGTLLSPSLVGYLGFGPLLIGIYILYQQLRSTENKSTAVISAMGAPSRVWLTTVVLMFSNSADSIAVLLPLLAESGSMPTLLIVSIYLLTSILWCAISIKIASNADLAKRINDRGEKLVPWVMIAVGIYVLSNTGTDSLLTGVTSL